MNSFSIKAAAQISGVSDACIRAWEKRYNCINPSRNGVNHRLYSYEDVERLSLLNKLTSKGMKISQLTKHSNEELKKIFLSVSKNRPEGVFEKKAESNFAPRASLQLIADSWSARRFDVAYHEAGKLIANSDLLELAKTYLPEIKNLTQGWSSHSLYSKAEIAAFELHIHYLSLQRASLEKADTTPIRSVLVSTSEAFDPMFEASVNLLLPAHELDSYHFSNQGNLDFVFPFVQTVKPKYLFIIGKATDSSCKQILEQFEASSATQVVFIERSSRALAATPKPFELLKVLRTLSEVDTFLTETHFF